MNEFIDIPTKLRELKEKKKEKEEKEELDYQEWKSSILQQEKNKLNDLCNIVVKYIMKDIQTDEYYRYTFTLDNHDQVLLKIYHSMNNYTLSKNECRFLNEELTDTLAPHYPTYNFIYDFNFEKKDSYILSLTFREKNTFIHPYPKSSIECYPVVDKYNKDIPEEEVDGIASLFGSNDDF